MALGRVPISSRLLEPGREYKPQPQALVFLSVIRAGNLLLPSAILPPWPTPNILPN